MTGIAVSNVSAMRSGQRRRRRVRVREPPAEDHVLQLEQVRGRVVGREAGRDALQRVPVRAE